jgi:hypothetical protein
MHAELVRVALHEVDMKIVAGARMHVLQWRRNLLWDEVLLDGKRQASSHGLFNREKVYGLVFGRDADGRGGDQVMLILDPGYGTYDYTHNGQKLKGVRLESVEGTLVSYGSLDPKALEKPATFADWMKKSMGMDWGADHTRRPN